MFWFLLFSCSDKNDALMEEIEDVSGDIDGDGFWGDGDCDETNPNNYEGATEICDGVDNNCDGQIDEGVLSTFYGDGDGDGFGAEGIAVETCEIPDGFAFTAGDCNDADPNVYPAAEELCDDIDNDCNGEIDDGLSEVVYEDADGDGFGDSLSSLPLCIPPEGYVENAFDCDDNNADINPTAEEVCDEMDNDCDGGIDNNAIDESIWFRDQDNDGYGGSAETLESCILPSGYSQYDTDCNDQDPQIHPFAEELCDEVDNDCDTLVDEGVLNHYFQDADGDGFGDFTNFIEGCALIAGYVDNAEDCNDASSSVFPGASEYCNEIDDDCDLLVDENDALDVATWYADVDGDGYGDSAVPYASCEEPPSYVAQTGDCDDGRPNVNPDASEYCTTAYDDDCDGNTNDDGAVGCTEYFEDIDGDGYGIQQSSCLCVPEDNFQSLLDTDCDDADPAVFPDTIENCATMYDDNCDGDTNEIGSANCVYYHYDYDGDGHGTTDRLCMCEPSGIYESLLDDDCDDTNALVSPSEVEICDELDIDENCDGFADDASAVGAVIWYMDADGDGFGEVDTTKTQCDNPIGYVDTDGDCDDSLNLVNPSVVETCFTTDDDDCSGSNNDVGAVGCVDFYLDTDGDGYGLGNDSQCQCRGENDYTSVVIGDCDDFDDEISPAMLETCDSANDENCNGLVDEAGAENCTVYYYDFDGDGYGIGTNTTCLCTPDGYYRGLLGGDCEDMDASINPSQQNCGLMGDIYDGDAGLVLSNREKDMSQDARQFVGGFDYNGDGISDLAVVDYGYDTLYQDAGGVFVYLGPLTTNVDVSSGVGAHLIFTMEQATAMAGQAGISVGNWDSDPYDEIFVNVLGGGFLIDDNLSGQVTNTHSNATSYAYSMFLMGDLDGDGFADAATDQGGLLFGDSNGSFTNSGENLSQCCGGNYSMVTLQNYPADIDGDGANEWLAVDDANVSVGSFVGQQVSWHQIIGVGSSTYGRVTGGDFNGDGYMDLVASNRQYVHYDQFQGTLQNAGGVWVYNGSADGITGASISDADWAFYGNSYTCIGSQLLSEDVDNDGFDDLITASKISGSCGDSSTHLFYGPFTELFDSNGSSRPSRPEDSDATFSDMGGGASKAGDQNQDGYADLLIGGCHDYSCSSDSIYLFYGAPN